MTAISQADQERRDAGVAETADLLHSASIHLLRSVRRHDARSGLTPSRLSALSVVVFAGPLPLSDLASAEGVRPPTMTRIVSALEAAGLVTREMSARDRRVALVRTTASGEQMLQEARARRIGQLAEQLALLRPSDLSILRRAAELIEQLAHPPA
jgi:DNA-binding MarR family transcriptional regulator